MTVHLPTNCTVSMDTLRAIRARHPVRNEATQYAPGEYEIGYGNRSNVHKDTYLGTCECENLLRNDIMYVEAHIRLSVARRIPDWAYQVLVSYLFDVGPRSHFAHSRLAMLHSIGVEGIKDGLAGAAHESRFGADIGRSARFYECSLWP